MIRTSRLSAGFIAAGLALASPAAAVCFLGCTTTRTGAAARSVVTESLGLPLPEGAEVTHILQGGFQDKFIQIRIDVGRSDLAATLGALGVAGNWQEAPRDTRRFGSVQPDWWRVEQLSLGRRVSGAISGFARTDVVWGRTGGRRLVVYVFAFQF